MLCVTINSTVKAQRLIVDPCNMKPVNILKFYFKCTDFIRISIILKYDQVIWKY